MDPCSPFTGILDVLQQAITMAAYANIAFDRDLEGGRTMNRLMMILALNLTLMLTPGMAADPSLVLYLPLDDGEGTVTADASLYENDGVIVGNAQWVPGRIGGALEIVSGSHVEMAEIPQYDITSQASLMTWMRTSSVTTWARLIDKSQWQTSGFDLVLNLDSAIPRLEFFVNNTTSLVDGVTPVDDNEWHFVAGTFGSPTLRIYVDGVLEGESESIGGVDINPNVFPIFLGGEASSSGGQQYTGTLDDVAVFDRELLGEEIMDIFLNGMTRSEFASQPQPRGKAADTRREVTLSWSPGALAASHDVYLGTDSEAVAAATHDSPEFMVNTTDTSYTAGERFDLEQTYYWRVDEVNDLDPNSPWQGGVWSFTVEAVAYPLPSPAVSVTASSSHTLSDPINTMNGSGLNQNDQHSTNGDDMWLAGAGDPNVMLVYTFDSVYKLNQMRIWNSNQSSESLLGLGAKNVTLATSLDGTTWSDLRTLELPQASGLPTEEGSLVDLNQVAAPSVRLNIHDNWGGLIPQYGLSEVRFYYIPTFAREFAPADGTAGLNPIVPLSWRSGREAAQHEVHLGTDPNSLSLAGSVTDPSLDVSVQLGTTNYWQVVEVNDAEDPSAWPGPILSFSTRDFVLIDDMESYRDAEDSWIWQSWSDGFSDPDNGAVVGHGDLPETEIVFEGSNAMPLSFSGASWTTHALDWTDWTAGGVRSLRLFFSGSMDNTGGGLYVEVNGERVTYSDDAHIMSSQWRQWDVPLAGLGDLSQVESLIIGVTSGNGILYLDAIGLYPEMEALAAPTDPGVNGLAAQYSMEGDLSDSSGNNLHGTVEGGALFSPGLPGMGQAMDFDGLIDYSTLPIGPVMASADSMTVSLWADFSNQGGNWQRMIDFGTGTETYLFLSPRTGGNGPMRLSIRTGGGPNSEIDTSSTLSPGWHHIAATINGSDMSMTLHLDGILVATGATQVLPSDLGETTQNYLGYSQYTADAPYQGSMDEVRIYTRPLSPGEIHYLAGAR